MKRVKSSRKEERVVPKVVSRSCTTKHSASRRKAHNFDLKQPVLWGVSSLIFLTAVLVGLLWRSFDDSSLPAGDSQARVAQDETAKTIYGVALGDQFIRQSPGDIAAQLKDIHELGFTDVRFTVSWYIVQPANAKTYDWKLYDRLMVALDESRLNGLALIQYTPAWARSEECPRSAYCPPAIPQQFATFAAAVAKRYAPRGLHQYEIWNEPNIKSFWQPAPSAAAYAELLKATYPALKAANPESVVISGGMSGVSVASAGYVEPREYLKEMYEAGVAGNFDALGYHAYTFPDKPNDQDGGKNAWSKMSSVQPSLRGIMAANGDSEKKIWITEVGAPTNGPGAVVAEGVRRTASSDHVDDALQSTIASETLASSKKLPWLGALFWYTYRDKGTKVDSSENFYGLENYDGEPKPAQYIFKEFLHKEKTDG